MRGGCIRRLACNILWLEHNLQPTVCTLGSLGFSNAKNLLPPLRRNSEQNEKKKCFSHGNIILFYLVMDHLSWFAFRIELHPCIKCPQVIIPLVPIPLSLWASVGQMGKGGAEDWYALQESTDELQERLALENLWSQKLVVFLEKLNQYFLLIHLQGTKDGQCDHVILVNINLLRWSKHFSYHEDQQSSL